MKKRRPGEGMKYDEGYRLPSAIRRGLRGTVSPRVYPLCLLPIVGIMPAGVRIIPARLTLPDVPRGQRPAARTIRRFRPARGGQSASSAPVTTAFVGVLVFGPIWYKRCGTRDTGGKPPTRPPFGKVFPISWRRAGQRPGLPDAPDFSSRAGTTPLVALSRSMSVGKASPPSLSPVPNARPLKRMKVSILTRAPTCPLPGVYGACGVITQNCRSCRARHEYQFGGRRE